MILPRPRPAEKAALAQLAEAPQRQKRPATALLRILLFAAGLLAAGLLLHAAGPNLLANLHPTLAGAALMIVGGALLSAAGVPRSVTAFAAGYAFGLWLGLALAMAAQLAGCLLTFIWARAIARDAAQKWAERRLSGRLARLHATLRRRPFTTTLTIRLMPVGSNLLLNLAAGLAGIAATPFMAATAIGYLPQAAIFALLGSGVHVDRSLQWAIAAALFTASAALGLYFAKTPPDS